MPVSQNGYPANDRSLTALFDVPGSEVTFRLRKGVCGEALALLAGWVDKNVEDIDIRRGVRGFDVFDDWSYAERLVRGGASLSNHASGTAIDLNAVQHPLGVTGTWSVTEKRKINNYLQREWKDPATGRVVIRWGENYISRKDGMHFEIDDDEKAVARALVGYKERRRAEQQPKPIPKPADPADDELNWTEKVVKELPILKKGDKNWDVRRLQALLIASGVVTTDKNKYVDGDFGESTEGDVKQFQRLKNIKADGEVGQQTWTKLLGG